jgi:hypothetical protein
MNARSPETTLAGMALLLASAAMVAWYRPLPNGNAAASAIGAAPIIRAELDADVLDAAAQSVIDGNPFRLSRLPSDIAFSRTPPIGTVVPAVGIRPVLVLKGIVGGPPWQAVLDGIPGAPPGTVVKTGSTFDKLIVRSVTRDTVMVQGPDTTWRLTLRKGTDE